MALQLGILAPTAGASFPSPLPSSVALNIKLFNLIQFAMTNTLNWFQMWSTIGGQGPGWTRPRVFKTRELEVRLG